MTQSNHNFCVGDKVQFSLSNWRIGKSRASASFKTVSGSITEISDKGVATIKPPRSNKTRTCHVSNLRLEGERSALTDAVMGKGV